MSKLRPLVSALVITFIAASSSPASADPIEDLKDLVGEPPCSGPAPCPWPASWLYRCTTEGCYVIVDLGRTAIAVWLEALP